MCQVEARAESTWHNISVCLAEGSPVGADMDTPPSHGAMMQCPRQGCGGIATFGTYTFVEGDDSAFVDDETDRGPINRPKTQEVWHCPACGGYFSNKSK